MRARTLPLLLLATLPIACGTTGHPDSAGAPQPRKAESASLPSIAMPSPQPAAMPSAALARIAQPAPAMQPSASDREQYQPIERHGVLRVAETPVSTFSIDVDTGSYTNLRRLLRAGQLPPRDAIRVEELVNYFPYAYPLPKDNTPFAVSTEVAPTPWNRNSLLLRIGIQAADPAKETLPPANLVFLVDVSGSMSTADKLPLLKQAMKRFVAELRPQDRLSLVTYSGRTQVVLEPTAGDRKAQMIAAIDGLQAAGATAGGAGIELAYTLAQQGFLKDGINRVLLATDGDFNVGITRFETLKDLVAERRKLGISLTTLGFGTGNYNDQLMEQLADAGDGAYRYIDNLNEAQKVLVDEFSSTLATVAHDVKIQLEFNPAVVSEYRQIGFENRALRREDFSNDKVDAGEIGAGHRVTALYEITLAGTPGRLEPLRYAAAETARSKAGELAFLRLRYKPAHGEDSRLLEVPLRRADIRQDKGSEDFRFAAAVAAFGQRLSDGGRYLNDFGFNDIASLARASRGEDPYGYRGEFLGLVRLAEGLAATQPQPETERD
ncbi:VWA domain-containing protein [Azoarcus sp. TTM-91]|uniref:vWA domain-containing protein n=1 Tax=Azoarcus sp. TTM-91 TaxID=2691581 RepID=UPI002006E3F1|nr:VWA domain-containing protein [Azoarcus sp. TTM-91]